MNSSYSLLLADTGRVIAIFFSGEPSQRCTGKREPRVPLTTATPKPVKEPVKNAVTVGDMPKLERNDVILNRNGRKVKDLGTPFVVKSNASSDSAGKRSARQKGIKGSASLRSSSGRRAAARNKGSKGSVSSSSSSRKPAARNKGSKGSSLQNSIGALFKN